MLKLADVHTHLCDDYLKNDIENVRNNYLDAGVNIVIDSACNLKTALLAKEHAEKYSEIYFIAGIHPENFNDFHEINEIEKLLTHKKCVAVGEAGFDYHYEGYDKEKQKALFVKQIELANEYNLPLVIHSRDACLDTVTVLKENASKLKNGFLMHCYSESIETANQLIGLGAYFSFGGALTYKNSKKIDVLKNLPLSRVLIETDAPYLTPVPNRGKRNEPKYVKDVYCFVANALNISVEQLSAQLYENARVLFKKICSQT